MGDSQVVTGGEPPMESWPPLNTPQRQTPPLAASVAPPAATRQPGKRPGGPMGVYPSGDTGVSHDDRTRIDLPVIGAVTPGGGPEMTHEPQETPHQRQTRGAQLQQSVQPQLQPQPQPQLPAQRIDPPNMPAAQAQMSHAPWTVAPSWGVTSLNSPNTLAGLSYLFWWISGLFVYFNERKNRFVRFHAVQSILWTGALTVVSVALDILWELSGDLAAATRQPAFAHLGQGIALLGFLAVIALWLGPMFAAWSGHHLRLPIVGAYAERYAAPPREPFPPAPFPD